MNLYTLRIHKMVEKTKVEGPGNRMAFWVQGCSLHCEGCLEQDTWNPNEGYSISLKDLLNVFERNDIEGVTVLGGEPFEQAEILALFLKKVQIRKKNSIVFTGYTYEQLKDMNSVSINRLLEVIDLLIDGAFIKQLLETERPLVGSSNQRFIALSETGKELVQRMSEIRNKVEVRISRNGVVMVNGMWKKGEVRL